MMSVEKSAMISIFQLSLLNSGCSIPILFYPTHNLSLRASTAISSATVRQIFDVKTVQVQISQRTFYSHPPIQSYLAPTPFSQDSHPATLFTPTHTIILGPNTIFERLALSDFDLRGVTAARIRACILIRYIKSNRISTHTPTILLSIGYNIISHHRHNREIFFGGGKNKRRLTTAAWVIRRPAVHPNDGFRTGWSACYGAVGGKSVADVGGAGGVGVATEHVSSLVVRLVEWGEGV